IGVKVVEARQLQASGHILNPLVQVSYGEEIHNTSVKSATVDPWFDELMVFSAKKRPKELFEDFVEFKVFNSKSFRFDPIVGSFKLDVGATYDQPAHAYVNRWLILSNEEDSMSSASAGYLKISVVVLGPSDDCPDLSAKHGDSSDDIEANLLFPAGVSLQPSHFQITLFQAEDLPRMDAGTYQKFRKFFRFTSKPLKEMVDAYMIAAFAGREIRSKVVFTTEEPEFNQVLNLTFLFPSMSNNITLILRDCELVIGEYFLFPVVTGYLPTFGPAYVNFYGTVREFSAMGQEFDDAMNTGAMEGCAYRGRALIQVETLVGKYPDMPIHPVENSKIIQTRPLIRRRRFALHAVFHSATMIKEIDSAVEFEISIGNYGNKFETSIGPSPSTTQPTNAVFDGCAYYYLPWSPLRPYVSVGCHWEDITLRLEAMNQLLYTADALDAGIKELEKGIREQKSLKAQAQDFIRILNEFIVHIQEPLPSFKEGKDHPTVLDKHLRTRRETELGAILKTAFELKRSATDVNSGIKDLRTYEAIIRNLAIEPQDSLPDVILWMITGGDTRVAYQRIRAHDLLFSSHPMRRGRYCGRLHTLQLKYPGGKGQTIPALLRLRLWFGKETDQTEWTQIVDDSAEVMTFAETYENQVSILGNWVSRGPLMTRPKWSDASGYLSLPRENFKAPEGWEFQGDWFVDPEPSMLYDLDAGHSRFMVDTFQNMNRIPGGRWIPALTEWTDVRGDPAPVRDDVEAPPGWNWEDDWEVDMNRAVDEEGWEYAVEATLGGWGPVEKVYHLCRRRRWVRTRLLDPNAKEAQKPSVDYEGWEYAAMFNLRFHAHERKMDLVRRRRWHRRLVPTEGRPAIAPAFSMGEEAELKKKMIRAETEEEEKAEDEEAARNKANLFSSPRLFLIPKEAHKYQLRAYIYQARDVIPSDHDGTSDPFATVIFLNQSASTERVKNTLSPTWDQTLILHEIEIDGPIEAVAENPPSVVIEFFDHDKYGKSEFLGRTSGCPVVQREMQSRKPPKLTWLPITKGSLEAGELLAAFELLVGDSEMDLPYLPPKRGELFIVPSGIRPILQRTAVEILAWGLRNMDAYDFLAIRSPSVEFEIGGHETATSPITNFKKKPNFSETALFLDVNLPKDDCYLPPLNIRAKDSRAFGNTPMVGSTVIRSLQKYRLDGSVVRCPEPPSCQGIRDGHGQSPVMLRDKNKPSEVLVDLEAGSDHGEASGGTPTTTVAKVEDSGTASLVSTSELLKNGERAHIIEEAAGGLGNQGTASASHSMATVGSNKGSKGQEMDNTLDWWSKYYAAAGEKKQLSASFFAGGYKPLKLYNCNDKPCGQFKGTMRVYPLPGNPNDPMPPKAFGELPSSEPNEVLVRLYAIRARHLTPSDPGGEADPYIVVKCGKNELSSKKDYRSETLDPVFGQIFEFNTSIPVNKDVTVQVWDYDLTSYDDLIGETKIDLENRIITKHRGTCGISEQYHISGPYVWRDSQKPYQILQSVCRMRNLPPPEYRSNSLIVMGEQRYPLSAFEPEGTNLPSTVGPPEERLALHILHLFQLVPEHVETRPLYNPSYPGLVQGKLELFVDIFPKNIGRPGLPVDTSPRKATKYELRIIIWNTYDVQLTETNILGEEMSDIYVRGSLAGLEDSVQTTDTHYRYRAGQLDSDLWDDDLISRDDQIGEVSFLLTNLKPPARRREKCDYKTMLDVPNGEAAAGTDKVLAKPLNLFECKRIYGFWPLMYSNTEGKIVQTGKVEMEMELVPQEEAKKRPAGRGRSDPNENPKLPEPKRPADSFFWLTSPWKTFKFIIWRNNKCLILTIIIVIFLVLFLFLFIYSFPGFVAERAVGWLFFWVPDSRAVPGFKDLRASDEGDWWNARILP
ncbi:unnamed protein product, partial [Cyprideis torosa]